MSNFFKVLIVSIITLLLGISSFIFIFSDLFYLKQLDFVNINIENRYNRELADTAEKIDNLLVSIKDNEINELLKKIDFTKFLNRQTSKNIDLSMEFNNAKTLIVSSNYQLEKIKLIDNNRKLIFSTDENELVRKGAYITFSSRDSIENIEDLYEIKNNKIYFIFDNTNSYIIIKQNIEENKQPIAIALFYYRNTLFNDIIRRSNFFNFKKVYFIPNNIVILEKPNFVDTESIISFDITGNRVREVVFRDKSGNEITKFYRLFYKELKVANIYLCRFIDNDIFKLKKTQVMILFYFVLFSIYLLVLLIMFLKKSDLEKAKEKISLFVAALLEDMIEAKSKEELDRIYRYLSLKKENILTDILSNFRKLKDKDKKALEEELDDIFNRITESFKKREIITNDSSSLDKIESLLEKFVSVIAEKGINVTALPVNQAVSHSIGEPITKKPEEVETIEEVESVEEVEEIEEIKDDDTPRTEEEKPLEPEAVEEIEEAEEIEEVQEIESIEEVEGVGEAEPVTEVVEGEIEKNNEVITETLESESIIENQETLPEVNLDTQEAEEVEPIEENAIEIESIESIESAMSTLKEENLEEPSIIEWADKLEQETKDKNLEDTLEEVEEIAPIEEEKKLVETEKKRRLKTLDISDIEKFAKVEGISKIEEILNKEKIAEKKETTTDITDEIYKDKEENLSLTIENEEASLEEYSVEKILEKNIDIPEADEIDKILEEEIAKTEIPSDIAIELSRAPSEIITNDKEEEPVPKIPDEFYKTTDKKEDELADAIRDLMNEQSMYNSVIEEIYDKIKATSIIFLSKKEENLFKVDQKIGFDSIKNEISINKDDPLVKHLLTNKRVIFVSDISKIDKPFVDENIYSELSTVKSFLIYPVKMFGKIRAICLIFFKEDKTDDLDTILDLLDKKEAELKKSFTKKINF